MLPKDAKYLANYRTPPVYKERGRTPAGRSRRRGIREQPIRVRRRTERADNDDLNGEAVRPGTLIVISPYVLHRHRLLWEQPDAFDPQRFLGNAATMIDRFAYLPFGVGSRKCIGSTFALQEATLVLAMIVKHRSSAKARTRGVACPARDLATPAGGLPMIVSRRASNCLDDPQDRGRSRSLMSS
jgi:hypothetical protein